MIQYDPHRWSSHLFDVKGSMVKEILGRVTLCVLWSVLITIIHQLIPHASLDLSIPETGHMLIGAALGLLLVFRTNASYDRFWEGRKLWGSIVNDSRNLARQASTWLAESPAELRRIMVWTLAFPDAARERLRGNRELGPNAHLLPFEAAEKALEADHVPLAVTRQITAAINSAYRSGLLTDIQQATLDTSVQGLVNSIGACERIRSTPLPFAYTVHLRRALIFYCFTLPFAFVGRYGWDTIPATLLVAYILFGIEEIGVEIEDPFGVDENDLPLDTICNSLAANLRELIPATPGHPDA